MTHKTTVMSVAIHAVIYAFVFMFLQLNEGFQVSPTADLLNTARKEKTTLDPNIISEAKSRGATIAPMPKMPEKDPYAELSQRSAQLTKNN